MHQRKWIRSTHIFIFAFILQFSAHMTIASDCMSEFTKQNLETIGLVEQVKCLNSYSVGKSGADCLFSTPALIEYGMRGNA